MSQGVIPLTAGGGGAAVRGYINSALQRLQTRGSGTSRPPDIAAGEVWIETDNPGAGVWSVWEFDGTADVLIELLDTVNSARTPYGKTQDISDDSESLATTEYADRQVGQVVSMHDGAVATGTTTIPVDNTVPTSSEGNQYMTLSITPLSASSTLIIDVTGHFSHSAGARTAMALFKDSDTAALRVAECTSGTNHIPQKGTLRHVMTSGTTSTIAFKVRAGGLAAGTVTFNGSAGGGLFGGTYDSGIVIREILP